MDDDTPVGDDLLELALRHAREQRDEITLWLAVQTLMTDNVAMADEVLVDRLCVLQDRVENMMRLRYGLPARDAKESRRELRGEPEKNVRITPPAAVVIERIIREEIGELSDQLTRLTETVDAVNAQLTRERASGNP